MKRRANQHPRDLEWEESVFAGLLALTHDGAAVWHVDKRLAGAMRCEYGGESFWLWRGRLMIDDDLELPVTGDSARKLVDLVRAQQAEQHRQWVESAEQRESERRARINRALERVVEAGKHD